MHCPAGHLVPGPKFIPELVPPQPEPFSNTCHPLSITKSPAPRWPACPQSATAVSLLSQCQPLVQQCLLLCPQPCETTRLLLPGGSGTAQSPGSPRRDAKRAARSLPPCAPRCPEPARLRFPPCGVRCSSSSSSSFPCRGRPRRAAERPPSCAAVSGGYSLPLRGVTECPPSCSQVSGGYSLPLRGVTECPPQPLPFLRCSKGYPTQELGGCYSWEQRWSSAGGVVKGSQECPQLRGVTQECPQLRGVTQECPQLRGVSQECPQLKGVTKECSQLRGVTTECPQLRGVTQECLQLRGVTNECPQLRGVTKECPQLRGVTTECAQLRGVTKECPPLRAVTKECPPLRAVTKGSKECPPLRGVTKGSKECPQLRAVTKGSVSLEGTKGRSCSAQQLSRSRCPQHPRGPPRPSRLSPAGAKRCGHSKKSRCASKWLW